MSGRRWADNRRSRSRRSYVAEGVLVLIGIGICVWLVAGGGAHLIGGWLASLFVPG